MSTPASNKIILGYLVGALGASFFATKGILIKLALIEDVDAITTLTWRMIIALPFFILIGYFAIAAEWPKLMESCSPEKPWPPLGPSAHWVITLRPISTLQD